MSYDYQNDPSNPDAAPLYCPVYWFGGWAIEDWMQWHGSMKARYGLTYANETFVDKWFNHSWTEAPPVDKLNFWQPFRDYARDNGFLDAMYRGPGELVKVVDEVGDTVADVADDVKAAAKNTLSLTKLLPYLVPLAVVFIVAIYLIPIFGPQYKRAKGVVASK